MVWMLEHATHSGGCGFCIGLGITLRAGKSWILAVELPAVSGEHRDDGAHRLLPAVALVAHADAERVQFGRAGALAHAEFHPAAGQQIQRGDPLRHPVRLVGGQLHDAVAQPDVFGPLAGGGEEHFRGGGMRVFLQEVVLHLPDVVVAKPVGQFELGERLLEQVVFAGFRPGTGQLVFVEDAEFHVAPCFAESVAERSGRVKHGSSDPNDPKRRRRDMSGRVRRPHFARERPRTVPEPRAPLYEPG